MNTRMRFATIGLALSAAGCGSMHPSETTTVRDSGATPNPSLPSVIVQHLPSDPKSIDWDHPAYSRSIPPGADPVAEGALSFTPIVPQLSAPVWRTYVSDIEIPLGYRAVTYVLHFPVGPLFPSDGRISIREQPVENTTPAVLEEMAVEHAGSGQFTPLNIDGLPALLITGSGVGRVIVLDGPVRIDVTGPAVSPAAAQQLATQLVSHAGGGPPAGQ